MVNHLRRPALDRGVRLISGDKLGSPLVIIRHLATHPANLGAFGWGEPSIVGPTALGLLEHLTSRPRNGSSRCWRCSSTCYCSSGWPLRTPSRVSCAMPSLRHSVPSAVGGPARCRGPPRQARSWRSETCETVLGRGRGAARAHTSPRDSRSRRMGAYWVATSERSAACGVPTIPPRWRSAPVVGGVRSPGSTPGGGARGPHSRRPRTRTSRHHPRSHAQSTS